MAPAPFPQASIELDYPLFSVQFDPEDEHVLAVGGGGGAVRSGVGNKITVLELTSREELRKSGELALSSDEDSVMSLAFGPHKGRSSYLYAGVNSSPADIAKGKNEHLRSLTVDMSRSKAPSSKKTKDAKISEASRSSFFTNPDVSTYQRLLRTAGSMGAAATGMGRESQIAVFQAGGASPKARGVLELPKDAQDLDIVQKGENEFQVAFCYQYELHVINIGKTDGQPELVFTMPDDHGERPAFRSIRYISPNFILAASNLPKRSGILLQGLRLPSEGHAKARIAATVRVPGKISATALAVANLSPPASPSSPIGDTQFVIAVAGSDSSISLYTMNHVAGTKIDLLTDLHSLATMSDVHGGENITGLAFSNFATPKTHIRPQHISLASISLQKTVSVHSIDLKKHVDPTPRNRKGPPRPVRYVVAAQSHGISARPLAVVLAIIVLIMAIVGQGVMEMFGKSPPILQAHKFLPSWHGTIRSFDPPPPPMSSFLVDEFMVKLAGGKQPAAGETLVMWEPEHTAGIDDEGSMDDKRSINVDVHDVAVHGPGKTWEELGEEQKDAWKERLKEAGAWTAGMGESVFKGILFGEIAGAVGRAVGGG